MDVTPTRLRDDAIVEAVCQVHFASSKELPEVVLGRLTDYGHPGEFQLTRLPAAEVPPMIRRTDLNFKFQPLLELRAAQGRIVRIGENVLSVHLAGVGMYPGWGVYRPELERTLSHLFAKVSDVEILNVTLRYINAIVPSRHHIGDVHDLQLKVVIGRESFAGPMNLNFSERHGSSHLVTTRIAHTSFVQGVLPDQTVAVVDVEVSTPPGFVTGGMTSVLAWCDDAHTLEKKAFFRLIPAEVLPKLIEE